MIVLHKEDLGLEETLLLLLKVCSQIDQSGKLFTAGKFCFLNLEELLFPRSRVGSGDIEHFGNDVPLWKTEG